MKSFWWFKENFIAGMARPGFNATRWFDIPFSEAVFLGWLGRHSEGREGLESFREHLKSYAPKIFKFYQLDDVTGPKALLSFEDEAEFKRIVESLSKRTGIFKSFEIRGDEFHFELCKTQLNDEVTFLEEKGIKTIVSLTEKHHQKDFLEKKFNLHHIIVEDLNAPNKEQALELAEIVKYAQKKNEKMAVHCLAGIGRTSTMLMASHILMGEKHSELERTLKRQNPYFILTGSQAEFIYSLENK